MARTDKQERRRFKREDGFKLWNKEEREQYENRREALKQFILDITTPAPTPKKKDVFEELFG
jgi:hypothetical protein